MEELRKLYIDKGHYDLMVIIENSEDYTEECVKVVERIFYERSISDEELYALAVQISEEKVRGKLKNFSPLNDRLQIHKSIFLDQEVIRQIYVRELKDWMQYKNEFKFDVTQYIAY